MDKQNKPVRRFRVGSVTAAEWENTSEDGRIWKNYTFQRSYTKDGKTWENSESFTMRDLSDLMIVVWKILTDRVKEPEIQ